jgi:hypothetical protein
MGWCVPVKKSELKQRLKKIEDDRIWWIERYAEAKTLSNDREEAVLLLEQECRDLAGWLMSEFVTVHESKAADVDSILWKYLGTSNE